MEDKRQEHTHEDAQPMDGIRVIDIPPRNQFTVQVPLLMVVLVTTAFLVPVLGYLYTHIPHERVLPVTAQPSETTPLLMTPEPVQQHTVRIDRYNLLANLPEGWHETQVPVDMPLHVTNPLVAVTHSDAQCTVVYATLATEPFEESYVSTGAEEDIIRNGTHIARIEYRIATTTETLTALQDVSASSSPTIAYTYQPLYYDNGSHDVTRNAWVTYSNDGTPLSDVCKKDFRAVTTSLVRHFEVRPLARNDSGLLYMETHQGAGTLLLFRSTADNITRVVTTLDAGAIFKPTLHDGTLTFIGTGGDIRSYTLFSETPALAHPIALASGESVSDFRSIEHTLFYLVGPWCRSESTSCALTLMQYDPTTGDSTEITSQVPTPNIDALPLTDTPLPSSTTQLLQTKPTAIVHSWMVQNGALTVGPALFEGSVVERIPFIVYE